MIFEYLIVFALLLLSELLYFKIADRFNIIDKPNLRSSHSLITLRGGGIIFYVGVLLYFISSGFQYPWFFIGLSLMTLISFLDDVFTLSNKPRIIVHFLSVLLMSYELGLFSLPIVYLLISFVFIVGVINAYNFMDGINGITAVYSLAVCILLLLTNLSVKFIDSNLLIYTLIGIVVFGFFNFRNTAKTFAGDVGSVSMAFIVLFALGALIIKTENIIYLLFLVIYGLDSVWTIIRRIFLKENIFSAHRSHLYQYLANEAKINKLIVASAFALMQLILGLVTIWIAQQSLTIQIVYAVVVISVLSIIYLLLKNFIVRKFVLISGK